MHQRFRSIPGLSYDDVLVIPRYSEVLPSDVSLATSLAGISFDMPVMSAAMDTVTELAMARKMAQMGGVGVIHKNMTVESQADMVAILAEEQCKVAAAIGVGHYDRAEALIHAGVTMLVLDSAHGHSKGIIDTVSTLRQKFSHIPIIAGNIATASAALALKQAGANAVKVGIGPGSICTTRVVAGIGMPQFSAVLEVSEALAGTGVSVIADGGLKQSGDIVKALAAGANMVMLGSLLAGTDMSPGEVFCDSNGVQYKTYRGMGSMEAMVAGSADRYSQSSTSKKLVAEGVNGSVHYKGPTEDVIFQLMGGLRSGMGYTGSGNIQALRTTEFVQITASGLRESHPHSLNSFQKSPSLQ